MSSQTCVAVVFISGKSTWGRSIAPVLCVQMFRIHTVFGTTGNPEVLYSTADAVDRFLQVPLHFT